MRRDRAQPVVDDRVGAHAVGDVEIAEPQRTKRDAPLDALDRMTGGDDGADGILRNVAHETALGPEAVHPFGRRRIAREDRAIGARQRKAAAAGVARELGVEIGEHLRLNRDHDDAGEFAVFRRPPPADAEEFALAQARLQHPADERPGVAILLRPEIIAVGDDGRGRDRRERRGHQRVPVLVGDEDGVDRAGCLFQLAQFRMQSRLRRLDLLVGEIAGDRVHAGEGQVDRLEYPGRMLGHDAQAGP